MKNMQKRLGGYAQIFTKVLDLPRFGRLEDRLWRRANELLLAAKCEDCGGELPSVADMAWLLNVPQLQLVQELEALNDSGLVASTGATWHYREALVGALLFQRPGVLQGPAADQHSAQSKLRNAERSHLAPNDRIHSARS